MHFNSKSIAHSMLMQMHWVIAIMVGCVMAMCVAVMITASYFQAYLRRKDLEHRRRIQLRLNREKD